MSPMSQGLFSAKMWLSFFDEQIEDSAGETILEHRPCWEKSYGRGEDTRDRKRNCNLIQ